MELAGFPQSEEVMEISKQVFNFVISLEKSGKGLENCHPI
jgi:hypothetical protein